MDKKVFLLDKECYSEKLAKSLTEKDLEDIVSDEDYTEDFTIIKIDANDYPSVDAAIKGEGICCVNEYYYRAFGF